MCVLSHRVLWSQLLLVWVLFWRAGADQLNPTVSPETEFVAIPENVTVIEGQPALLKCKMSQTVDKCSWYYLKHDLDMFVASDEAILVKHFPSIRNQDCSIRINKTRVLQSGQWICKGLQILARKYVVSPPAFLRVLPSAERDPALESNEPNTPRPKVEDPISTESALMFQHLPEGGHIVNANLGKSTRIGCQVNRELESCSWIRPDGTTLIIGESGSELYTLEGNLKAGNCSLVISEVTPWDEGNWRCVVSTGEQGGDKLSPLIHLHVFEFGPHPDDGYLHQNGEGVSLVGILVATSVALLVVVLSLVGYMYRRIWRNRRTSHKYLEANRAAHCTTWHQGCKLMDEGGSEMCSRTGSRSDLSLRYVDMSGKTKEGYEMRPASSIRSSVSSRTTLSTVPVSPGIHLESEHSARSSAHFSLHSLNGQGKGGLEGAQGHAPAHRTESHDNEGPVYEEIDEVAMRMRASNPHLPDYININEDDEGYMIPRTRSFGAISQHSRAQTPLPTPPTEKRPAPSKAPPYSKITQTGLITDPQFHDDSVEGETPEGLLQPSSRPTDGSNEGEPGKEDTPDYDLPKSAGEEEATTGPVFV